MEAVALYLGGVGPFGTRAGLAPQGYGGADWWVARTFPEARGVGVGGAGFGAWSRWFYGGRRNFREGEQNPLSAG
jgi:hypothetical protein